MSDFAVALIAAFGREPVPRNLRTEGAFEREFAIPVAIRVAQQHPDVALFIHPWSNKKCCSPTCNGPGGTGRVQGCPKCWTASKKWGTVAAFGTKHTFDMVAKDKLKKLAVEIKLIDASGSRMPNGGIQRFLGQCALAAAMHDEVIGLCGHRGTLNEKFQTDTKAVQNWSKKQNIQLVFLRVP